MNPSQWQIRIRWALLVALPLVLTACTMEEFRTRIALVVVAPFLLLIGVLWFLHRRKGDEGEQWEESHFPDSDDDDDDENHYLM